MDRVAEPDGLERILCFDEETGARVWTHTYPSKYSVSYPDGPRAAVTVADGRAYSLGTMGHLRCLDATSGEVLWEKNPNVDYEIWSPPFGVCTSPLVEDDLLIVQIGQKPDGCIVAWDKATGEERWRAFEDEPSYSSPRIIEQAGRRVLVCWTGEHIAGLNPTNGEVYWTFPTPPNKVVINIADPVITGDRVFLSSFYDGSYMLYLTEDTPGIGLVWRREGRNERKTDALHAINSTPVLWKDHIYGADSYGEYRGLDAATGDRLFEDLSIVPRSRWATVHTVRNGDRHWIFNEKGELIIAELTPEGVNQISRAQLISPTAGQYSGTYSQVRKATEASADTNEQISTFSQTSGVVWSHPAYANKHVFIRNDNWLVCADLGQR
jgi:outer membrane protein assembly factor BamB